MSLFDRVPPWIMSWAATGPNGNDDLVQVPTYTSVVDRNGGQMLQADFFDGFGASSDLIEPAMSRKFPEGGPVYMFLEVEGMIQSVIAEDLTIGDVAQVVTDAIAAIRQIRTGLKICLTGWEHPQYFYAWQRGFAPNALIDWNTEVKTALAPLVDAISPYWYPPLATDLEIPADAIRRAFDANAEETLRVAGGSYTFPTREIVPLIWWQYRPGSGYALKWISDEDALRILHGLDLVKARHAGVWWHSAVGGGGTLEYGIPGLTTQQSIDAYTDFWHKRYPALVKRYFETRSSGGWSGPSGPTNPTGAFF